MCVRGQWIQKNLDVVEVNQRRWFEERGGWLENVDRTHLELISGKPVQQKMYGNTKIVASDTVSYPPRFNIHSKKMKTLTLQPSRVQPKKFDRALI